jgi:hypothetical protein
MCALLVLQCSCSGCRSLQCRWGGGCRSALSIPEAGLRLGAAYAYNHTDPKQQCRVHCKDLIQVTKQGTHKQAPQKNHSVVAVLHSTTILMDM